MPPTSSLRPTPVQSSVGSSAGPGAPVTVTRSARFRHALEQLDRYARLRDTIVVLEGESGTGKTLLARELHRRSSRAAGPFREVSLAALDDALAGSDLFGHLVGAFTGARQTRSGHFQSANGGTLFLDEIGKASLAVQDKLLCVIETNELWPVGADRPVRVDVRLVVATNVPLASLVATEHFLRDLNARLGLFRVLLPPLRERREDIPLLVEYFISRHAPRCGYEDELPQVDAALLDALARADWPDNLRQLDGTVQRLLVDAEGAAVLTLDHCRGDLEHLRFGGRSRVEELTPEHVSRAVTEARGSVSGAARALGVARTTVYRHLRRDGGAPLPTRDTAV